MKKLWELYHQPSLQNKTMEYAVAAINNIVADTNGMFVFGPGAAITDIDSIDEEAIFSEIYRAMQSFSNISKLYDGKEYDDEDVIEYMIKHHGLLGAALIRETLTYTSTGDTLYHCPYPHMVCLNLASFYVDKAQLSMVHWYKVMRDSGDVPSNIIRCTKAYRDGDRKTMAKFRKFLKCCLHVCEYLIDQPVLKDCDVLQKDCYDLFKMSGMITKVLEYESQYNLKN